MGTRFLAVSRCTDSKRSLTAIGAFVLLAFLLGISPQPALAQFSSPGGGVDDSNGVFQLEGNATKDSGICFNAALPSIATPGAGNSCPGGFTFVAFGAQTDDWASINSNTGNFIATTGIVGDAINTNGDTIFTSGGSKDINDVSSWLWKNGKPQGKDDIEHVFAAAYNRSSDGHTVITLGMDRFDNSGDATAGFWFFQDSTVGIGATCGSGGGCPFNGHHSVGDLLVVSDFSTGGAVSNIAVYTWTGNGLSGANPNIPGALVGECNPITGNKDLCAIVNPVDGLTSPWGFSNKSGHVVFDHGELLEVGLNVIFGANIPCFTTFMGETRSSTSTTATLSDFSPPASFPLCGIKVDKKCNGNGKVSADGSTIAYTAAVGSGWTVTVTNTGIGNLYNPTVTDTLPDGTTATYAVSSSCGATLNCLAGKQSATVQVDFTVTCSAGVCTGSGGGPVSNPLSVTNSAKDFAFTAPNSGGTKITPKPDVASTDSCSASTQGALTVTKHCDGTHGGPILVSNGTNVIVKVPFTGTVCNNSGVGGESITNISVSDDPTADSLTIDKTTLAPTECANVAGIYTPSSISSGDGTGGGRYFFSDTLTATGTGVLKGDTVKNQGGVSCPICPDGLCTNVPLP